jgi:hypothetical protein
MKEEPNQCGLFICCSYVEDYWVFGLCPLSHILKNTFWKLDLLPFSGDGGRHLLCWVCNRELISITGPVDRDRSSFWNAVSFRIRDDGQSPKKTSNPKCYIPPSEPFRIYLLLCCLCASYTDEYYFLGCYVVGSGKSFDTEDGGSTFLQNVSKLLTDYKANIPKESTLHSRWCENHKSHR